MHNRYIRAAGALATLVLAGSTAALTAGPAGAATASYNDTRVTASGTHVVDRVTGAAGARDVAAVAPAVSTQVKVSGLFGPDSGAGTYSLVSPASIDGVTLQLSTVDGGNVVISGSGTPSSTATTSEQGTVRLVYTDADNDVAIVDVPVVVGTNSVQLQNPAEGNGGATTYEVSDISSVNDNTDGAVVFYVTTTEIAPSGGSTVTTTSTAEAATASESNLPTGLASAQPLSPAGATATPGEYNDVLVRATDSVGASALGETRITITASRVRTPRVSSVGDFANAFGNGPDAYRQLYYPGARVAGWTVTRGDIATNLIRVQVGTTTGGAPIYRLEFERYFGSSRGASGECMTQVNTSVLEETCTESSLAQDWYLNGSSYLTNAASGLFVTPHGTGALLTVSTDPTSGGGSGVYHWVSLGSYRS